ncbi:MAG: tyrosine-type recombinase/integrase [Actinomycetota bacterium]
MAHITKRPDRPRPYLVRWIDTSNQERSKAFVRKVDAEAHLIAVEASKLRGEYVDPRLGRVTFGEYSEKVAAQKVNQRPSTRARDESYFKNLILPTFGAMPLQTIELSDVKTWLAGLQARGSAPATIRKAYQLLAGVLAEAVRERRIARTPCLDIRPGDLPKLEHSEMRFLSTQEVQQLADAMDPKFRPLVLTAAFTGLRFGELAALRLKHVNLLKRTVSVEEGMTDVKGHQAFGPLKTKASRRTVTIPAFLVDVLAKHLKARAPLGPDDLIFVGAYGAPLRASSFRRRFWYPAVKASVGPPCRFHDLRHTHAAMLIQAGTHAKLIQRRLGHAQIGVTLNTYGHLMEGLDESAADALETAWNGLADGPETDQAGSGRP